MASLKSVFLFLFCSVSLFAQNEYRFTYQFIVFDEELIFVDSISKVYYKLDYKGEIEIDNFDSMPDGTRYYLNDLDSATEEEFLKQLSKTNLATKTKNTFQIQKVDQDWLLLKIDNDRNIDYVYPLGIKSHKINDNYFFIGFDEDAWELVYFIYHKSGLVGFYENNVLKPGKKFRIDKRMKSKIKAELKDLFPDYKSTLPMGKISHFGFIKDQPILFNKEENKAFSFNIANEGVNGFLRNEINASPKQLFKINDQNKIHNLSDLKDLVFKDTTEEKKDIYYVHFYKNIFSRVEKLSSGDLKHLDYEYLISVFNVDDDQLYIGKEIVVCRQNEKLVILKKGVVLSCVSDIDIRSKYGKVKHNLYHIEYRLVNENGKKNLTDKTGQNYLLNGWVDSIYCNLKYIVTINNGMKTLYNSQFKELNMSKAKHWDLFSYSPQFIDRETNELRYVYYDNSYHSKMEDPEIYHCLTGMSPEFYDFSTNEIGSFEMKNFRLRKEYKSEEMDYKLIPKLEHKYTFKFDADSVANLVELERYNYEESIANVFLSFEEKRFVPYLSFIYYKGEKKGIGKFILYNHEDKTMEVESFFEYHKDVKFEYFDSAHPIKYSHNDLYGYVGVSETAFARELSKFEGMYARFVLPNGDTGWLTKKGELVKD